jgi:DNA-binding CsgD family transcriptional regulator
MPAAAPPAVVPLRPCRPADAGLAADSPLRPLFAAVAAGAPLEPAMRTVVRSLGFDAFTYRLAAALPARSRGRAWTTGPSEWLDVYEANGYDAVDPRLTRTRDRTAPLVWDGAALPASGRVGGFLRDAAHFGVRSGVAVSLRALRGERILVTLDSAVSPVDPPRAARVMRRLGSVLLLATGFHDAFMAPTLDGAAWPARTGQALSPRELECLRMAAHGLTSLDIGDKLGVAGRTVHFHFHNVIAKLGVLNRQEAIARAITCGLIRIET